MLIQTVDEKFSGALANISACVPYYLRFYSLFKRRAVEDEDVTLRVNMVDAVNPIIEYNTKFIDSLNSATLAAILCVELNRILLKHCSTRKLADPQLNYKASNIVCYDPSIIPLFKTAIESVRFGEDLPNDANPRIRAELPPEYDHDSDCQLEVLYEMLSKKKKGPAGPCNGQGQGGAGGQGQQPQNQNQNGNGNGKGKGQGKGQGGGQGGGNNPMRDAANRHFNNNSPAQTEKWGENSIAESTIAQRVNTTDASQWGNMPSILREKILAANRQVVDPRQALRDFIATAYSDNQLDTRMKYNRRNPEWSGILPGKRHDQQFHLGIFADASGSMGSDDIKLCIATVNDFIKFEADVDFAWWDCSCEKPSARLKPMYESNVTGGGGTNPQCIIDLIHKEKLHYDAIIVLTDCGFTWSRPNEYRDIFIIRTPTAKDAPAWVGKHQMSMKSLNEYINSKKH